MTAVAPPQPFQSIPRNGWTASNGPANGLSSMSADDMSRMLLPRKGAQRSNSSSSLASSASSSSTVVTPTIQSTSAATSANGDWATRKRPVRSIWPTSKTEPTSGLSTARPQSVTTGASGASAASAMASLQSPSVITQPPDPIIPSHPQQHAQQQQQQNGVARTAQITENTPVLYLTPMNGTFERKTITVPFYPDVLRIGRQTNGKTVPTPHNGYFDSKVLSRQHAEVWADRQGKIWIRDVKSSNGTFVNGQRLSQENKDSDPHELREQDMLELGIDIVSEDQKTVVHHKVAARVEHAGFYGAATNSLLDLNFGDLDASASSSLMGATLSQGLAQMRRTASQTSVGSNGRGPPSVAGANVNNVAHQRQNHFWLAPVNMDQIVKKLNAEYKAAKQQSLDLQRAAQYIDTILNEPPPRRESVQKTSPMDRARGVASLKDSLKTRFSDPPAPPPQAPLPEKPDVAHRLTSSMDAPTQSLLRRSDTERPKAASTNSSPTGPGTGMTDHQSSALQIASLSEALCATRKEMEAQSLRLREVEDLLVQERVRREDAEERAKRLEKERDDNGTTSEIPIINGAIRKQEDLPSSIDDTNLEIGMPQQPAEAVTPETLQQRLELLMIEFNEVKAAAERWRREKEHAERERDDERAQRESLAEMVEKLRAAEDERATRQAKREERRRQGMAKRASERKAENDPQEEWSDFDEEEEGMNESRNVTKREGSIQNGHIATPTHTSGFDHADTLALVTHPSQLAQAAPYLSAMSVVLIGVAVMALVNKMQRGER